MVGIEGLKMSLSVPVGTSGALSDSQIGGGAWIESRVIECVEPYFNALIHLNLMVFNRDIFTFYLLKSWARCFRYNEVCVEGVRGRNWI